MINIDNEYNIGDIVYLKTDTEQYPRIIFCIMVFKSELVYKTACGTTISEHYDFELSPEKNVLIEL